MPPTKRLSILMTSPGNLPTISCQLTKSEATSPNGFQDIFIYFKFSMSTFAKGNYSKKTQRTITRKKYHNLFFNFHQVIYCLSSISCPSLELQAVISFEVSSFLCRIFQKAITKKNYLFFNFRQVIYSLSAIS